MFHQKKVPQKVVLPEEGIRCNVYIQLQPEATYQVFCHHIYYVLDEAHP